jgi:hypothetical protein
MRLNEAALEGGKTVAICLSGAIIEPDKETAPDAQRTSIQAALIPAV